MKFSSRGNTALGQLLQDTAAEAGLKQLVKTPTREENLLDLVMTDLLGTTVTVGQQFKTGDHRWILATVPMAIPTTERVERKVWNYRAADWDRLNDTLAEVDWEFLRRVPPDEGAARLTEIILEHAHGAIGQRTVNEFKSSHPWLTEEVLQSMKVAEDAEGTEFERERAEDCSAKIMRAREDYISKTKAELKTYKDKPKMWWKTTNVLSGAPAKTCSIPAMKTSSKEWILDPAGKANLIAQTQAAKCTVSDVEENKYT